jgi:hypothetical protein
MDFLSTLQSLTLDDFPESAMKLVMPFIYRIYIQNLCSHSSTLLISQHL